MVSWVLSFLDGTIDGPRYLDMLIEVGVLQLQARPDSAELFFRQDGIPPHCSLAINQYLDQEFPHPWMGKRINIEWSPRSPDLTPMDFFFWGAVKDKVYSRKPVTVRQLKNFIQDAFKEIHSNRNWCITVCDSVGDGLQEFISAEAGHFEHLRDKIFNYMYVIKPVIKVLLYK
ncbi:putative mariner [Trichonephila inaurata madagascariensis]|uniref:Putative mariner n=1 Tax=Trichonephila inaurata madagascariensis TaxID=2747483 RepID=A0A8X6Y9M3_9ARAC|nr:putative mariner [Trichonephila inaurata madagascariensis]